MHKGNSRLRRQAAHFCSSRDRSGECNGQRLTQLSMVDSRKGAPEVAVGKKCGGLVAVFLAYALMPAAVAACAHGHHGRLLGGRTC